MTGKVFKLFATTLALWMLGCASKPPERGADRVFLLPSDDGKSSGVVVSTRDAEIALTTPYSGVEVSSLGMVRSAATPEEIERRYGGLLAAQAKPPKLFTMFFVLGTDELTPASKTAFEEARKEIASWAGAEVVVIGHTDRLGSDDFNDALARKRAEVVASRLVAAGVPRAKIVVTSRGEREPLVPTADGVPEPRNRRVEVKVR